MKPVFILIYISTTVDVIQPWGLSGLGLQPCSNTIESEGSNPAQGKIIECEMRLREKSEM